MSYQNSTLWDETRKLQTELKELRFASQCLFYAGLLQFSVILLLACRVLNWF